MNPKLILAWALALAAVLAVGSAAWAGKQNDTLVFSSEREEQNADVYFNSSREGIIISRLVWDPLVYRDPNDMSYKPHLATSWKWVDDLTLDFNLRKGVKFHNGEEFDADDVTYILNFAADPANKTIARRAREFIRKAERLSKYKVRIHLKVVAPHILEYFSSSDLVIYPNEYYAKVGPKGMNLKPVGTGPYRVTSVDPGKLIKFERFDGHFAGSAKGKGSIKYLQFKTIPDQAVQVAELLAGGIDWIWRVKPDMADNLENDPRLSVARGGSMRIGYVGMDAAGRAGKSPMQDRRVRQAIAHAIDREAIAKNLAGGNSKVIHVACFPSQFGCDDSGAPRYEFNPDKAKALLAEAGFPNGFEIDMGAYRERHYAEAIVGYLHEVGIRAKLNFLKYSALRDKLRGGGVPFFFMTWGSGSVNDISAITSYFFRFSSDDVYRDEQVRDWLKKGDTTVDPSIRRANYKKALTRIAKSTGCPCSPIR